MIELIEKTRVYDVETFRPKVNKHSDKFSWRLYKYLKDKPYSRFYTGPNGDFPDHTEIYVGLLDVAEGWFYGCRLSYILQGRAETFAFSGKDFQSYPDFLEQYAKIGRCLWDKSHTAWMMDDESRWQYSEDKQTRSCLWCNDKVQTRSEKTISQTYEFWD